MKQIASFAALLYLAPFALAQNLTFVRPRFDALNANDEGLPQLTAQNHVTVKWRSDFQFTTLAVYQKVGNAYLEKEIIAQDVRSDRTEAQWQVGEVPIDLDTTFHFQLRNGVNQDCNGCTLNSKNFVVSRAEKSSSTTASPATQTTISTGDSVSTTDGATGGPRTPATAGAQSSEGSTSATSEEADDHLGLGLGVGLGLGIPLLLAIAGTLFWMRRRRRRRDSLPRGRQPSPAHSPDRASGAWMYQDGRHSQQDMLFRPSTTARSEVSSWSHRSWIEPFEFEQAEMLDQDAISQLRESIYSHSRSRRSQISLSNAGSEWGMLEGIPEQPQAVHDGHWSRTL